MVPALKLVAYRWFPVALVPNASPLYTAPDVELSTAITAAVGLTLKFQAEIVPSSVSKMKAAANVEPGTRNPDVGFQIMPVGDETKPDCEPSGGGMVTTSGTILPSPAYRVERPE